MALEYDILFAESDQEVVMDLAKIQGRNKTMLRNNVVNVAWSLLHLPVTWTRPGQGQKGHEDLKLALVRQVRGRQQEVMIDLRQHHSKLKQGTIFE
jgi:hypothetical protein